MKRIKHIAIICMIIMPLADVRASEVIDFGIIYEITSSTTLKAVGVVSSNKSLLDIPDTVVFRDRKFAVTEIGREAFASINSVVRVRIPETVTKIGDNPFGISGNGANCIEVSLPSKLREIPTNCFSGFSNLKTVKLPDSLRIIGNNAFSGCSSLTSITIPEQVTDIGEAAFKGCKGLSELTIPANVQKLWYNAFEACDKLTSVTVLCNSAIFETSVFARCSLLKEIRFVGTVTSIGARSFAGCVSLEELSLPDGLKEIGYEAFLNCTSLKHIYIPNSVSAIYMGAFMGCESLEEINLPVSMIILSGDVLNGCKKIQMLTIPENVKGIAPRTIDGCSSLRQLVLRSEEMIYIEDGVFSQKNYDNVELVVPTGMLQQYQQAEGWKNFKTISEEEVTDRQIVVTLRVDPFGSVKVDGQVYEAGTRSITLPANQPVAFEVAADETHVISRAEHKREWGVDQYSEKVKTGTLTIPEVSNGDSFVFQFENGAADIDILQTDKGKVTIHARKNHTYRFMVMPEEGWQINSVTWNGEDMTPKIKPNAYVETPVVIANSVLQVAVEKSLSAIPSLSPNRLKVHAQGECLYIENADKGEIVNIYGTDGTLIKTLMGNGSTLTTTLKRNHVYLIKTKQKTVKILL